MITRTTDAWLVPASEGRHLTTFNASEGHDWTSVGDGRRSAMADDIRQAAEDGELSHETAWYLLDDLDIEAWYEAYAPDCGAL